RAIRPTGGGWSPEEGVLGAGAGVRIADRLAIVVDPPAPTQVTSQRVQLGPLTAPESRHATVNRPADLPDAIDAGGYIAAADALYALSAGPQKGVLGGDGVVVTTLTGSERLGVGRTDHLARVIDAEGGTRGVSADRAEVLHSMHAVPEVGM